MAPAFRNYFITHNTIITYRIVRGMFQSRYRRKGVNIETAAKSFEEMKQKTILRLNKAFSEEPPTPNPSSIKQKTKPEQVSTVQAQPIQTNTVASVPNEVHQTLFINYLNEWFETAKRNIKASSVQDYASSYKVLAKEFKNKTIGSLTRQYLQEYLYNLAEEGKHRTAKKYKQILNATFELIAEDFGIRNPLKKIKLPYYEVNHAKAFTYEEEKRLMQCCIENPEWKGAMAVMVLNLFGLRRGELKTIEVIEINSHKFLRVETEKVRKGHNKKYREIPFTPMVEKYLEYINFETAKTCSESSMVRFFKQHFPERHLHELRSTFISRVKECGVNLEIVMLWDGHEQDKEVCSSKVDREYTTYSKEYHYSESRKVNYEL